MRRIFSHVLAQPARGGDTGAVGEFRRRHGLALEDLAGMLDVELEELRLYEAGAAPPWVGYALVGLDYELSGATLTVGEEASSSNASAAGSEGQQNPDAGCAGGARGG